MEANEAPEKIYLNWVNYPLEEMQVEYTRTDALIEKVEEYIYKQLNEGCLECGDIEKFIGEMKNYMKGE